MKSGKPSGADQGLEVILLSAEFSEKGKKGPLKVKKRKILMITTLHIYVLGRNKHKVKFVKNLVYLQAVTQCMLPERFNFILHFQGAADKEFESLM